MKNKKILLVLSSLALGSAIASCTKQNTNVDNNQTRGEQKVVDPLHNNDMNKYVDLYDNEQKDIIFASPNVKIEYDFDKLVLDGVTEYPMTKELAKHQGTLEDPMDIYSAIHCAGAGDTVYLLPGTYDCPERLYIEYNHSGNAKKPITVRNYTDDTHKGTVTLDFSKVKTLKNGVLEHIADNSRGIQLNGHYWHWYGIDVVNAGDNGMYIGGSFNKVELCNFHENQDTGLQIGRAASTTDIADWPHDNLVLNCTSYNNYDVLSKGENADGFAAKLTVGEGNVFDGCIAYRNSDDGWDLFAKTDSGNIGTITIINCVAFENGFVLNKTKSATDYKGDDTQTEDGFLVSYACHDGDGNGFKLGGSIMTGDTVVKNCLAFNNRMGGFADNSNPGVLSLTDCTAFNNSVYMSMTTTTNTVDETGKTGIYGGNDGQSSNFAMARTEASYNNFTGCLSYITNATEGQEVAWDTYRGSAKYSLFASGYNKHMSITSPIDASSYESSKMGDLYKKPITDDSFKSVKALPEGENFNGRTDINTLFRNADGSVNMHDFLALKDESLLKYNNGKAVGCTLNKTKMEDYEHYNFTNFEGQDISKSYAKVQGALDVIDIMCDKNAVFQDVNLLTKVNGLDVSWYSSDENVISVGYNTVASISGRTYVIGNVKRSRTEDKDIKLIATVVDGAVCLNKEFTLHVIKEEAGIGKVVGIADKYVCEQYDDFVKPVINVTDKASYSGNKLELDKDYTIDVKYEYAISTKDKFYPVDDVYTACAGVYKVSYDINSKLNDNKNVKGSYLVYVNSKEALIDVSESAELASKYGIELQDGKAIAVNGSRDGAKVTAAFTNIYGYMYLATAPKGTTMTADEVIKNGVRADIVDEVCDAVAPNANTDEYQVFMVVTNRTEIEAKKCISDVYSFDITIKHISTAKDLYDVLTGSNSSTVIYVLDNDIDFAQEALDFTGKTAAFTGVLNGNGHKISNIIINSNAADQSTNIIGKLRNGTIMNVTFENIVINALNDKEKNTGIIGVMCGGYISNVALKNVYVSGLDQLGTLVGQVSGGTNYINNVSLTGDYSTEVPSGTDDEKKAKYEALKPAVRSKGKYFGGLVGNMQKDTAELKAELNMEDIYVKAYIGDHHDVGYVGGILGRDKNEFDSYTLNMSRCVFVGIVDTNKTYSGGIVGSIDSASGHVTVKNCVSDAILVCTSLVLGYSEEAEGQKNNSPVIGRLSENIELQSFSGNAGSFKDYHGIVNSTSDNFGENILKDGFFKNREYDLENVWQLTENGIVLRNSL